DPVHLQSPEILQLNAKLFQLGKSAVNASKLPYDPELKLTLSRATLEEVEIPRRGFLGLFPGPTDPKTGQPLTQKDQLFRGRNVVVWIDGVPVFYLPYIQGNVHDPLGPLENIGFNYNRIYGFQLAVTLDVYDLLGITPVPNTRWRVDLDYLSRRGPGFGTEYRYSETELFGIPGRYSGNIRGNYLNDKASDILGG